ncbi:MAG: glutamate racemase [Acidobacteria bacterium]|nr:glutamate racemase [Acidobacteriota bacterium]
MSRPIGIFDSGVGGLTVLKALRARLPHCDFVYLGDTARVPYGRKPKEMVRGFASEIAWFLEQLDVACIVVACNTASACALPGLADEVSVPVWGVIEPGIEAARRATITGRVGVIGTKGTIASGVYQRGLQAAGLEVWAQACPMFVHLVEEGLADSEDADVLARHYLKGRGDIDTLILGCTHYPVLAPVIQRVVGGGVKLVSSAEVTAEVVCAAVGGDAPDGQGRVTHYVTGGVPAYQHTAEVIGGVEGKVIPLDVNRLADAGVSVRANRAAI